MERVMRLVPIFLLSIFTFLPGANLGTATAAESSLAGTFTNPINPGPDPWLLWHEGNYYLATTQGDCIRI